MGIRRKMLDKNSEYENKKPIEQLLNAVSQHITMKSAITNEIKSKLHVLINSFIRSFVRSFVCSFVH